MNRSPQRQNLDFKRHAESMARFLGARVGISLFLVFSITLAGLVWLESIRYFAPETKLIILKGLGVLLALSVVFVIAFYWILKKQSLSLTRPEAIAKAIGERSPQLGDRLLNAVQLSRTQPADGISSSLHAAAIQWAAQKLQEVSPKLLFPREAVLRYLKRSMVLAAGLLLLFLLSYQHSSAAVSRLFQAREQFEYPLPISVAIETDQYRALAGDTITVSGSVTGRQVDALMLQIVGKSDTAVYQLDVDRNQTYSLTLPQVTESFQAQAMITNHRFWEPWDVIRSPELKIQVINRPLIQNLTARIKPPSYTGLATEVFTRDIMELSAYRGSWISLEARVSKPVAAAILHSKVLGERSMDIQGNLINYGFRVLKDDQVWIELIDDEDVRNRDPLTYPIYVRPDVRPLARILAPGQDVILGERLELPLRLKLDDDFGFSRLELNYRILHPDYLLEDTTVYALRIDLPKASRTNLEFNYVWDLNAIALMPEDAVEYWITVYDNNQIDGPQSGVSQKWMARLPSLDEMFEEIAQGNQEVQKESEQVLDVVKDIKEKIDELALEVQKDPNLSWDQQQEATEAMEQVETLKEQLEQISEQLDEMLDAAKDQQLFSEETLDKYSELQRLMEQLITPELEAAMERLREAMEQNDAQEMKAAMEDFQSAMEDFEKSVERTLEIFKQVAIEQKIDELTSRLNDLAERQEKLSENLENKDGAEASQQEQKIADDYDKAREAAQDLENMLEEQQELDSSELEQLQQEMAESGIEDALQEAAQKMSQQQMSMAKPPANKAARAMRQMAERSEQMQSGLQQQMMEQVMSEFRAALLKTLRLSQSQEGLESPTSQTSRQSSLLRDYADRQMELIGGLQQLAAELKELGNKTFAVTPAMGRAMGKVQAEMQEAIEQLEARNPRKSAQSQALARESLNKMARQIAGAMQSLQQSGESSGFGDYMEQLMEMAGQQQGLNQQTMMQLGMGSPSMMQQLARQQMQLREALSKIEEGMGSDSRMLGDLGKIGEEMEAVARELRNKRPSQDVHEKQERILSRLLDAQRSATQQDFSKKRKSETGKEDRRWQGSGPLPADLGEARNRLYEELLYSLKQDYSREEQALIRAYLNQLEAELNE